LRFLVRHAYERVPFYRRHFDEHGLEIDKVSGIHDLERIPTVQKQDFISNRQEDNFARDTKVSRLVRHRTNGSTGEPFLFYVSKLEDDLLSLFRLSISLHLGMRVTDRQVRVRLPHVRDHGKIGMLLRAFRLFRVYNVSTLLLPEEALNEIRKIRPHIISGLASLIYQMALLMDAKDRELIRPRFIFLGGDTVTPMMHRRVSEGFGARVVESYASHEFNIIAWECSMGGQLHISDGSVLVEVLNGNSPVSPGERGEAVVTALHSFAQPFIRYRLADIVTRGERTCPCGLPFSTIHSVQGRMLDRLSFSGGRLVSPDLFFEKIESTAPWVKQYQITQEDEKLMTVKVVPFQRPSKRLVEELEEVLRMDVPAEVAVRLVLVDRIERGPGGKYRVCQNRMSSPYSTQE
jgi:phenylacetate-CoA ligase